METMATRPEAVLNQYAVFMGYLSSAIRGLRLVIVTWTTFVIFDLYMSALKLKDFWSLMAITIVETVWVLGVPENEKLSKTVYTFFSPQFSTPRTPIEIPRATGVAGIFEALGQALVFIFILCPVGAPHIVGAYFSSAVAIWRLTQRDYVDWSQGYSNNDNKLGPALNVLYSLVVVQGALYLCKTIFSIKAKAVTDFVASKYRLDQKAHQVVTDYFRETRLRVEKDPSFARGGWNLFSYAVELLVSTSADRYLSGARLLSGILRGQGCDDHKNLAKLALLGSPLAANVVRKLLWTLNSAAPYGQEAREHAARIMAILAGELRMDKFPRGLRSIESLLDNNSNLVLMIAGLNILTALANEEDSRRAMRNMPSLLPKMMGTIQNIIERHHSIGNDDGDEHSAWDEVARPALRLLDDLMDSQGGAPGGSSMAISVSTLENITQCNMCHHDLREAARKVLQILPRNDASSLPRDDAEARRNIIPSSTNNDEVVVPIPVSEIENEGC